MCSSWCCLQKHRGLQKAGLAQSSGIRSFSHPSLAICSFLARPSGNAGFVSHAGSPPLPPTLGWTGERFCWHCVLHVRQNGQKWCLNWPWIANSSVRSTILMSLLYLFTPKCNNWKSVFRLHKTHDFAKLTCLGADFFPFIFRTCNSTCNFLFKIDF